MFTYQLQKRGKYSKLGFDTICCDHVASLFGFVDPVVFVCVAQNACPTHRNCSKEIDAPKSQE